MMNNKTSPHILHIEDNMDIKAFVFSVLQDMAKITYVESLEDAKQKLAAEHFDLVILDLILPDGSGLDLIKDLKAMQPPLPVIVHSAHEMSDTIKGVDAVLSKLHTTEEDLRQLVVELSA